LLNRIPEERVIYSRLTREKEGLMQSLIETTARAKGFRTVKGKIPGRDDLGDIDLAIVSDSEQLCLLLELKWFIDPAEVREILERREELQKGITQIEARVAAIRGGCPDCLAMLGRAPLTTQGAIVSNNWIGDSSIQKQSWPVITEAHLIAKLNSAEALSCVIEWLSRRQYLPVLGTHFAVQTAELVIGEWSMEWYAIDSKIETSFLLL